MCRKLIGTVVILAVGAALIGKTGWSYFRTGVGQVVGAVQDSVPIEFEIRRARTMLSDLVPEMKKNLVAIAQEEAGLENLNDEIAALEARQTKDKTEIVRLRDDVDSGNPKFVYAGREYTVSEVRSDLTRRFERHRTADETLANLRKIKDARLLSLTAARDKMSGMMAAKRQLEVEIEQLDSRLKMVQAAETTSRLCLDDGQLSRTKRLIADLESRLKVSEQLVSADVEAVDEIQLTDDEADISDRIAEYFAQPKDSSGSVSSDSASSSSQVAAKSQRP